MVKDKEPILETPYKDVPPPEYEWNTLVEFLLEKAEENIQLGKSNWITNTVTGEALTFKDIDPMSRKAASAMARRGMKKGDIALYLTMDVTKIYTTLLGIWRIGGIAYSSYPEDTYDTLVDRLVKTKAKWILCDPMSVAQVQKAVAEVGWPVEIIVFGEVDGCVSIEELYYDDGKACPDTPVGQLDDPILILCTSGTTGKSKGAIYTNRCILAFCLGTAGIPYFAAPSLIATRCTHVLGCFFPVRTIFTGAWSLMMHQITKKNIFEAVDKYKPILAFGFPTYLSLLVTDPEAANYDRSSLELICTGGIVLTPQYYELMMTLPNMQNVLNGYGMTECGVMTTTVDLARSKTGIVMIKNVPYLSVGCLYPNSSLKILDIETGNTLGVNQTGEIAIKSLIQSVGYWKQPEETAAAFQDGWLRTGDLGYYDDNGYIYVVDRIKETFKYFNNHVSPAELEEIILRHPTVDEVSVFGIHDPEGGDRIPRAAVVLKPGETITPEQLRQFVDEKVASFKQLRGGLYVVPALPRGKTGKVTRALVAQMKFES